MGLNFLLLHHTPHHFSLQFPHLCIQSTARQQFLMRPPFNNSSLVQHDDLIRINNSRKTMGDEVVKASDN